jgi:hypothetical protein
MQYFVKVRQFAFDDALCSLTQAVAIRYIDILCRF